MEPDSERAINECNGMMMDGIQLNVRKMLRKNNPQGGGGGGASNMGGGSMGRNEGGQQKPLFGKNPDIGTSHVYLSCIYFDPR